MIMNGILPSGKEHESTSKTLNNLFSRNRTVNGSFIQKAEITNKYLNEL
jgi:hypothetical protein